MTSRRDSRKSIRQTSQNVLERRGIVPEAITLDVPSGSNNLMDLFKTKSADYQTCSKAEIQGKRMAMEKTPSDKLLDMIGKSVEPPAIMQRQPSKVMIDLSPMIKE